MAHNAGSQPGQGSVPLLTGSQTLPVVRILDETPVRGMEFDLWPYRGGIVVNHGGCFTSSARYGALESHLAQIKAWLDRPENGDEFVVLMLENHLDAADLDRVAGMLDQTFGERIFTLEDLRSRATARLGDDIGTPWPTPQQLTQRGKQLMVVTDSAPLFVSTPIG